eukprot:TRINITY_DN4425_c1_g2_i1.p1 TRINITY_DN4425_c1_g2~~TRINITY_DN4425_c1_g2_i1.p1  ORF type:complete len:176 (-),score=11.73 TRINITY_DN4425_c1_g2_i1:490-969(-)
MTGAYTLGVSVLDRSAMVKNIIGDCIFGPLVLLSLLPVSLRLSSAMRTDPITTWFATVCYGCIYALALMIYVVPLDILGVRVVRHPEYGVYVGVVGSIMLLLWNAWLFRDSFKRRNRIDHETGSDSGTQHVSTAPDKQAASADEPESESVVDVESSTWI